MDKSFLRKMTRRHQYKSIGKCIYCLDASNPNELTIEHIIPEAIGGQLEFLGASCTRCQEVIGRYEGRLMNSLFEPFRILGDIKGKGKLRPYVKTWGEAGEGIRGSVHKDHHLGMIALPTFDFNAYFSTPKSEWKNLFNVAVKQIGGGAISNHLYQAFTTGQVTDFKRLLCKVAHGYWMAEHGLSNFTPALSEIIRNKTSAGFDIFVGMSPNRSDKTSDDLHDIQSGLIEVEGFTYGYVDIGLFNLFQIPTTYRVVVGSVGRVKTFIKPLAAWHNDDFVPPPGDMIVFSFTPEGLTPPSLPKTLSQRYK